MFKGHMTYDPYNPTGPNRLVIIHDVMERAMQRDLDKLRDSLPEEDRPKFEAERDIHRQAIINHFAEYGTYPDFSGVKKVETT